jgi:hypothetical protein
MARPQPLTAPANAAAIDPETSFRPLAGPASWIASGLLVGLSAFHYHTAGFGLLRDATHRSLISSCYISACSPTSRRLWRSPPTLRAARLARLK